MLNILRKKGFAKKIIWVIAIVIIISFGFFGTAYLLTGQGRSSYAGKIFGKKITFDDFTKIYRTIRIQAIRQYGYNLSKVEHLLNLEAQTWDRMILLYEADSRRIKIANKEVIKTIQEDPSFERNGQFDILLYNAILRNLQTRPRDYEENVRDNLKIAELYKQVTSSVTIAEEDVFDEYKNRNEKIQVSYVFVSPETFKKDITVEPPETEQYYQDHKSEFLMPATTNVRYITFDFPEEPDVEVGEEETLGDSGTKEEKSPETKTPAEEQGPSLEEEKDLLREKADTVFQELLVDPDMARVAGQNGLTVQSTGFFSMEQPNLTLGWSYDLLNEIFQMKENEVHEPFETPNGLSIVQVIEKREPYIPEFKEAQEKAREAVLNGKAKEIAKKKASEYLEAVNEELDKSKLRDFPKAAKELKLEIHQTPVFNRGQYLPQIGISKEFQEAAFGLTDDQKLSGVVETATGYCLLHLDEYVPIENSEYEKDKETLAQQLSDEKRNTVFGDFIAQLRIKADLFDNIAHLREKDE